MHRRMHVDTIFRTCGWQRHSAVDFVKVRSELPQAFKACMFCAGVKFCNL